MIVSRISRFCAVLCTFQMLVYSHYISATEAQVSSFFGMKDTLSSLPNIDAYNCDLNLEFDFSTRRNTYDHILRFDNNGQFISSDVVEQNIWNRMTAEPLSAQHVENQLGHIFCEARRLANAKNSCICARRAEQFLIN
jgi:hypothetical protein